MSDRPTPMRCQATALMTVNTREVLMAIVDAHKTQQTLVLVAGLLNFAQLPLSEQATWIEVAEQIFLKGE